MKKLSLIILSLLAVLVSCKKAPEVNLKYVDVEREVLTIGTTTATFQCDYQYIATLKSAKIYYGIGESGMSSKEMQVVSSSLYTEITGLASSTAYNYYYEFYNGYNSMQSAVKSFTTESSPVTLPTVITADVTEITAESAVCGGNVTNDGGGTVTARGICWSTSLNPTINDSFTTDGDGICSFISNMTELSGNTTYHVRAYATNEAGTAYGLDKEFTTPDSHEYVDLGLPSGLLWATCNVGANVPEEYGDYFAWGETQPKDYYDFNTYQHCNGWHGWLTKYCSKSNYGYNGYTDTLTILEPCDDAAFVNWNNGWRIPTNEEGFELINYTTCTFTTLNGVNGFRFTASNGNSIFLPAAGYYENDVLYCIGELANYWLSTLDTTFPDEANSIHILSSLNMGNGNYRNTGLSVRPVRSIRKD